MRETVRKFRDNGKERCKLEKEKQKNSLEEKTTGNVTSGINHTSEITGHDSEKCDTSDGQGRQLEANWEK